MRDVYDTCTTAAAVFVWGGGRECIPMERVHRKEEMEEVEVKAL